MEAGDSVDLAGVKAVIKEEGNNLESLISILQQIQQRYGYVPREGADLVARVLDTHAIRSATDVTYWVRGM